eukprot:m.342079 g.342079  ORF g.342079 m.342079 type:complete len:610 (+) comp20876_c0_seq1:138-1967(+)
MWSNVARIGSVGGAAMVATWSLHNQSTPFKVLKWRLTLDTSDMTTSVHHIFTRRLPLMQCHETYQSDVLEVTKPVVLAKEATPSAHTDFPEPDRKIKGKRFTRVTKKPSAFEKSYTRTEVSKHDGSLPDGSIWVTYMDGVYDVTEFIKEHPGGAFILQAAGGSVDDFWEFWAYHHSSAKVIKFLDNLRIGKLKDYEATNHEDDLYKNDPTPSEVDRGLGQVMLIEKPWCTETYATEMAKDYYTSNADLFVRNHAPVPLYDDNDIKEYELTIQMGQKTKAVSLRELKERFQTYIVPSILQCAGNRASHNIKENPKGSGFIGTPFEHIDLGMLGNVEFAGVRMKEFLVSLYPELLNVKKDDLNDMFVEFIGDDDYYASVPLSIVMSPDSACLLATHMNGQPLTRDHGYPLRAIIPGVAGARNVKWLREISIRNDEGDSPWNRIHYKEGPVGNKKSIMRLPLQSLITTPVNGDALGGIMSLEVKGVAFSGYGTEIKQVQCSVDEGKTWHDCTMLTDEVSKPRAKSEVNKPVKHIGKHSHKYPLKKSSSRTFAWVRWHCSIELPQTESTTPVEIWCRCTDSEKTTQPNVGELNGGYVYNGYHKIQVHVQTTSS